MVTSAILLQECGSRTGPFSLVDTLQPPNHHPSTNNHPTPPNHPNPLPQASGDERLMNPVAFAESHPACPLNAAGQPVIYNGMPWRQHLMLMVTSAKLLADTEALLQVGAREGWEGGGVGGSGVGGSGVGRMGA